MLRNKNAKQAGAYVPASCLTAPFTFYACFIIIKHIKVMKGIPMVKGMFSFKDFVDVLEAIHEGVMIVDSDYIVRFYNNTMGIIDGYTPSEVIGKSYLELFPESIYEKSTILPAFKERRRTINEVQSYVTAKGRRNSLITSTVPIVEDDRVVAVIEICKDISVERKLLDEIIQLQSVISRPSEKKAKNGICSYSFEDIVGRSPNLMDAVKVAKNASKSNSFVLISGETGTGKEIFAQSIHNLSPRRDKKFVAVNCAALPGELMEGILFGTTRGGFTGSTDRAGLFEEANHGTLLLDEINSMEPILQGKLLRVLQDGMVRRVGGTKDIPLDVRIISTTNSSMQTAIKENHFRNDLYYRLSVVDISIPPLRARGDDILYIAEHYINKFNHTFSKSVRGISEEVREIFMTYRWPGNVREMKHCIEGVMNIIDDSSLILREHLPASILENLSASPEVFASSQSLSSLKPAPEPSFKENSGEPVKNHDAEPQDLSDNSLKSATDLLEKKLILEALEQSKGNVSQAAASLSMKRPTLQYKMKRYGISKDNLTVTYDLK